MADMGLIPFPAHPIMAVAASIPAYGTAYVIDATTDDVGWVWRAPEAMVITHVLYRQTSLTGSPGTLRVGIQSVSASTGLLTGTWLGPTAAGYVDITSYNSANNSLFIVCALGESVTVARGDLFGVMLDPLSGTWDASNTISVSSHISGGTRVNPYGINNGAKATTTVCTVALRTASKTYGFPVESLPTINNTSASSPDEYGLKFTLPAACSSFTVVGARITCNWTATRNPTIVLYDSDGTTVLQSVAIDTDQIITGQGAADIMFDETTLSTLTPGNAYRLVLQAGASSSGNLSLFTVPTAGDMSAITPATVAYTARTDAGAWTDTTTQLPCIQALISDMSVNAGGLAAPHVGPTALVRA